MCEELLEVDVDNEVASALLHKNKMKKVRIRDPTG